MIHSYCSHCGLFLSVREEFAGGRGVCPRCSTSLRIPRPLGRDQARNATQLRYLARQAVTGSPAGVPQIVEAVFGPSSRYECSSCGAVYESLKLGEQSMHATCPSCQQSNDPAIADVAFPRKTEPPKPKAASACRPRRKEYSEADWERMRRQVEEEIRASAEAEARRAAERYVLEARREADRLREESAAIQQRIAQTQADAETVRQERNALQEKLDLTEQQRREHQQAEEQTQQELARLRAQAEDVARRAEEAEHIRAERERFQQERQRLDDERHEYQAEARAELNRERAARMQAEAALDRLREELEKLRADHEALRASMAGPAEDAPESRCTADEPSEERFDAVASHQEAVDDEGMTSTAEDEESDETVETDESEESTESPAEPADADWGEVGAVSIPELGGLGQVQEEDFLFIPDTVDPSDSINRILQRGSDARSAEAEHYPEDEDYDEELDDLPSGVEESHLALDAVDEAEEDAQANALGQRCEWYYSLNGEHGGPISTEDLRRRLREGPWDKHGLVRHRDSTLWEPADEHPEFQKEAFAAALSVGGRAHPTQVWIEGLTKNLSVLMFGFLLVAVIMLAVGGMQFTLGRGHGEVFEIVNWLLAGLTLVLVIFGGWLLEKNQEFFEYLPKSLRVMALMGIWGLVVCAVCFVALAVLT